MAGVFSVLPQEFFSPLASPNREDYAACLLIFHSLFQDSPGGVERSALVGRYAEYVAETGRQLIGDIAGIDQTDMTDEPVDSAGAIGGLDPDRAEAGRILRKLVAAGWMGEETLPDYTRLVTIAAHAKPFLDALAATQGGGSLEYESHIVAIYSSLCGDAAKEHGHHAVLNAHYHLTLLIDSLKVLSQNIRVHYERLLTQTAGADIPEILRLHYDRYLEEVVDRAYARLKTSDNLSRYRPRIARSVNGFLTDKKWMEKTAAAFALLRRESADEARRRLVAMMEEIRDQLRSLDPTLDEIDRRNMLYARSSLERIRSRLRSDSSTAGLLIRIARAAAGNPAIPARLAHHLYRAKWLGKESRYIRTFRESFASTAAPRALKDQVELERAEAELRLRIAKQLTPDRIAAWLDGKAREAAGMTGNTGTEILWAHELAVDAESFVRVLHATAYGESRAGRFPWAVEWAKTGDGTREVAVEAAGWVFRKHGYRRRR